MHKGGKPMGKGNARFRSMLGAASTAKPTRGKRMGKKKR